MQTNLSSVKALVFDVFGTVVDWRGTIIAEGAALNAQLEQSVDWGRLADAWRAGYAPAMNRVRRGELPWQTIDQLHRHILDTLIEPFGLHGWSEGQLDQLNRVWHRLRPWPDSVAGLARLRAHYIVATLSNGNMGLLVRMAKHAGLPWDCILSAELVRHYKPDAEVYRMAAELLNLLPHEVLMVAAHQDDLRAAGAVGLCTAFVPRPLEFGPDATRPLAPDPTFDLVAADFLDLATQLNV